MSAVLAVDIGNTRIKWGWHRDGGWLRQGWVATAAAASLAGELGPALAAEQVVVSNVAGAAVAAQVAAALQGAGGTPQWIVSRHSQCGVTSGYADPAALGPDRWAALIGAWQLLHAACVVANAGTTLTVDALSADGAFLGGCIVPGYELMRGALARDTANLAARDGDFSYFPDNTGDAIASGAINALAGSIERMVRFVADGAGAQPPVVLSGGGAAVLEHRLNAPVTVVDNLVLEGLLQIALQPAAGTDRRNKP